MVFPAVGVDRAPEDTVDLLSSLAYNGEQLSFRQDHRREDEV
jgi:hypothetical protein